MTYSAKHLRRVGVSETSVLTYVTLGRRHAKGDVFLDPYVKKSSGRMKNDAHIIANWFNSNRHRWTDDEVCRAHEMLISIQHGPAHYWRSLLEENLLPLHMSAIESWAVREIQTPGSVDMDAYTEAKEALATLLYYKLRLRDCDDYTSKLKQFLVKVFKNETSTDNELFL